MPLVRHKFIDHLINPNTETLIIGTFNPETEENPADFFYGRSRNYLWKLLPTAYNENSLKGEPIKQKLSFINNHRIDFIDLIAEVNVEEVTNYEDSYLDSRVTEWKDVISEMKKLHHLKNVCLTRKTFTGIPKIKLQVNAIKEYCIQNGINFKYLITPARYYNQAKQDKWTKFFSH